VDTRPRKVEAADAVLNDVHRMPLLAQVIGEWPVDARIVLDDQNPHRCLDFLVAKAVSAPPRRPSLA
jgi:hypothetical protein